MRTIIRHNKIDIPDLPELESVAMGGGAYKAINIAAWLLLSTVAGLIIAAIYSVCVVRRWDFWNAWLQLSAVVVIASGITAYLMFRFTHWFDYSWKTLPEGLSIRGVGRGRFIRWDDIVESESNIDKHGMYHYKLRTSNESVKITCLTNTTLMKPGSISASISLISPVFPASMWQHLRRIGKAHNEDIPPGTLSLWANITDMVPREMDWHNPKPPRIAPFIWGAVAAILGAIVLAYMVGFNRVGRFFGENWHSVYGGLAAIYAAYELRVHTVISAEMREDRIEARTMIGRITLSWDHLTSAHLDAKGLTLKGKGGKITIPYTLEDESAYLLVLSAVRRIRKSSFHTPILIPQTLMDLPRYIQTLPVLQKIATSTSVEIKYPFYVTPLLLLPVIIGVALYILIIGGPLLLKVFIAIALLAISVPYLLKSSVRSLKVDSEGITQRMMGNILVVKWADVALYSYNPATTTKPARYILKDTCGRSLINLTLAVGAVDERERIISLMNAKLAGLRREEEYKVGTLA